MLLFLKSMVVGETPTMGYVSKINGVSPNQHFAAMAGVSPATFREADII